MTQHVSFILRLKLALDLIRKVAGGEMYTTRYMCKGSVSQSLGQKLSDKNQNLSEKKRQIRIKVKRPTYLSGNKL